MAGNDQVSSHELANSLSSLGETTTAAELVRKQGQSKKLKVISEKKLMEWILAMLKQHMAGKADSFSDAEKEELLRKTQKELEKRILREQAAEAERSRIQNELQSAMGALNNTRSSQADFEKALEALNAKLANAEQTSQDLQQDNYELQDQLQEKMAMLSTTIAEKDKLRDTVRQQMMHSGDLIGGVLGLDNSYYGGRHQEENPVPEDANQDVQFYHDFDTGSKVIGTLMTDLERLRGIAKKSLEDQAESDKDPRKNLLESDLALLESLKEGSLQALDVAAPVAGLIEALDGARSEAEAMEDAVARVTGASSQKTPFTELPDPNGNPADVLAGATTVARELAAELGRSRQRVIALKQIADEAENERGQMETDLQDLRGSYNQVLDALGKKAAEDHLVVPANVINEEASPADRGHAALEVIDQLKAGSPETDAAIAEQLAVVDRLLEDTTEARPAQSGKAAKGASKAKSAEIEIEPGKTPAAQLSDRLRKAGGALEQLVREQRAELDRAAKREQALAEQVQALARSRRAGPDSVRDPALDACVSELDEALGSQDKGVAATAARKVVEALQQQAEAEQAVNTSRIKKLGADLEKAKAAEAELAEARNELRQLQDQARGQAQASKAMAAQLLKAAKGDDRLADSTADLALALEQGADAQSNADELAKHLQSTVAALSARKVDLSRENDKLAAELAKSRAELEKHAEHRERSTNAERELAEVLVAAAKGDTDLADATADLALALDEARPGEPLPADVKAHVASTVSTLAERKKQLAEEADKLKAELESARAQLHEANERASGLETERDEMAESGKEIITQLRQQKDSREKEVQELRTENEAAAAKLGEFQDRMTEAEAANRKLAEALSALANAASKHEIQDAPSIEDPRMDLELALSQLPNEGEEDVVAPKDISQQIADSGQKLASALSARHKAAAGALDKAQTNHKQLMTEIEKLRGDIATTRSTLEERDNALKRNQAEVAAIRREMSDQGNSLAARVQELSNARSELAGAKADLDTANERMRDQEARLNEARAQLGEARKDLERLQSEHAEAHGRAEAAEQNQLQIAQSLRSLGGMGGSGMSDPISKAAQKLEMAKNSGGDELASAGKAFVQTVKDHSQRLAQELADTRSQLDAAKGGQSQLQDELANLRGAVVDRDHTIENLTSEIAKASDTHAHAVSQMIEKGAELDTLAERMKELQEQLRQTEAELEDYRARQGASAGHLGDEVSTLRADLAKEQQQRKSLEGLLSELREKTEASDARLKRQREEFQRMLEERDRIIQEKDSLLDEHGSKRVDLKGLEAQVETLTKQLASANERITEMESLHGAHAGATSKSGDLAKEIKKAHAERDGLREQKRQLEASLADAVGSTEELQTQLDEKRKEVQAAREEMTKELAEERQKTTMMKEEFRKLKEEVVGLRARLRRLTDGK